MAYEKRPGNLFHNIKGSQSSQAPTQPGIGGMGEVESPAPYLPLVRGVLSCSLLERLLDRVSNKEVKELSHQVLLD